jgi:peroxiredoxin
MVDKHRLSYEILSDRGNKLGREFGLVFKLPDDLREVYLQFDADLKKYNGDDSWTLPMPGSFIIDEKSIIRRAEVDPDYTIRPDPQQIVADLVRMRSLH